MSAKMNKLYYRSHLLTCVLCYFESRQVNIKKRQNRKRRLAFFKLVVFLSIVLHHINVIINIQRDLVIDKK